jgi:aerobic C4-dicarboxylate transport protein
LVVAKWEKAIDEDRMRRVLDHESETEASQPEVALGPPEPLLPQAAAGRTAS